MEWILIAAAAQLLFLDIPDHAAVDLAVHATRLTSAPRRSPRWSTPFCAIWRAPRTRSSRAPTRSTTTPRIGSPRVGARLTARRRRGRSRAPIATSRRSTSASRAMPRIGRADLTASSSPDGSVRLVTHAPVAELDGYGDGEWWVQDAAAALPARLLGEGRAGASSISARRLAARAPNWRAGASVTAVDRSAERLKRLAANFERLRLNAEVSFGRAVVRGGAVRRDLLDALCTATRDDPPPPRRRLDQTSGRSSAARRIAGASARQGGCADQAGRPHRLLHVLVGAGGGRSAYRLAVASQSGRPAPSYRGGGDWRSCRMRIAAGELRTLPCHLRGPTPRLSGLDGFFAARLQRRP